MKTLQLLFITLLLLSTHLLYAQDNDQKYTAAEQQAYEDQTSTNHSMAETDFGFISEFGSAISPAGNTGFGLFGDFSGSHLSLDNNEIQSQAGSNFTTLYVNYWGGDAWIGTGQVNSSDVYLGGSSNNGSLSAYDVMFVNGLTNRVGIGTSAPSSKLDIVHNSTLNDAHIELLENNNNDFARIKFKTNATGTNNDDKYWDIAARTGTTTQDAFNLWFYNGTTGNDFFSIDPNQNNIKIDGDVVPMDPALLYDLGNNPAEAWDDVVASDFVNASDRRLKKDIKPIKNVLTAIKKLNPVSYEYIQSYNPDGRKRTGFLAQEVQDIFPSVVVDEYVDIDPLTGDIIREKSDMLAMNYMELIPITIKAIQEQQEIIQEQSLKLDSVNEELALLRVEMEALKNLIKK